jgi:hypothetical protein
MKKPVRESKERSNADVALRSPMLAAAANFFFWGIGYLYNDERKVLGFLLFFGEFLLAIGIFTAGEANSGSSSASGPGAGISALMIILAFLVWSSALAYDAYCEAKRINKSFAKR